MADRQMLGETVYRQITDMILRQEIACGEKIAVDSLSKKLGVSRTPVTEAVQRLAKEGLVKLYPHRSAEVVSFDKKAKTDLGLTRIMLDTLAVQLAGRYGSPAEFDELRKIAEECYQVAAVGDVFNWIRLECEFHLGLAKIGKNKNLSHIMEDLYQKVRLLQFVSYVDNDISLNMIKLHFDMIDKLEQRDINGVIELIHKHLTYFYDLDEHTISLVKIDF
jgi:DNA-binding GntR family transcriptional regulator